MRIRQGVLVARELEPAVESLCAVFGIEVAYRDPGVGHFGLENAVMAIGDGFLEVVSPIARDTTAGRYLDRRGGDGGYMLIVQCDDLEADRARVEGLGVRIAWEVTLPDIAAIHLHPRDVGGAILSLDAADPPESWRWAGPDWRARVHTERVAAIEAAEIEASDPASLCARWSSVLGRSSGPGARGAREIRLDSGSIRFVADGGGRGDGIAGFDLRVRDRERILEEAAARGIEASSDGLELCGARFRLV